MNPKILFVWLALKILIFYEGMVMVNTMVVLMKVVRWWWQRHAGDSVKVVGRRNSGGIT